MSIRMRTLFWVATALGVLLLAQILISQRVVIANFETLEGEFLATDLKRVVTQVQRELESLDRTALDWATRNDTYQFVRDRNQAFVHSNIDPVIFGADGLNIDGLFFFAASGELVYGASYDRATGTVAPPGEGLLTHLREVRLGSSARADTRASGLAVIDGAAVLLASRPIQRGDHAGPVHGAVIMVRDLTERELERIAKTAHVNLRIHHWADPSAIEVPDLRAARERLNSEPTTIIVHDEDSVSAYGTLKGIDGGEAVMLAVDADRAIHQRGAAAAGYFALYLMVAGGVFLVLVALLLDGLVLRRLAALSRAISRLGRATSGGVDRRRVPVTGRDEITAVAETVNALIDVQNETQRELVRVERLRATGELAAGVSHNLNNLLTSIIGPAQLLRDHPDDPVRHEWVALLSSSATRAKELVERFQRGAGLRPSQPPRVEATDVNAAVSEVLEVARPRWSDEATALGRTIAVQAHYGDVASALADGSDLHHALLNLVFNAVDALPQGGTIALTTRTVHEHVEIVVRDDGVGMSEDTLGRIFTPFFTTKSDVGTGLGLSTAYHAVKSWGGDIVATSALGEGTEFVIRLRVADASPRTSNVGEVGAFATAEPRGEILVVDDDAGVRRVLDAALSRQYRVSQAVDGAQALSIAADSPPSVLIVDLGLTDQPGTELAAALRARDPTLVCILISGWSLEANDPRLGEFDFVLSKPFDSLRNVRAVVAEAFELAESHRDRSSHAGTPTAESPAAPCPGDYAPGTGR